MNLTIAPDGPTTESVGFTQSVGFTHGCSMSPLRGSIWYFCDPWVDTHGCSMSPLRGSIWYFVIRGLTPNPWVSPTAVFSSPLCGSKWLPCNNYALYIMH